jgi:hypothetical protein
LQPSVASARRPSIFTVRSIILVATSVLLVLILFGFCVSSFDSLCFARYYHRQYMRACFLKELLLILIVSCSLRS